MTNREMVNHNIGLTFDFLKEILKNPKLLTKIKNGSTIEFVQNDLPLTELTERKNGRKKIQYVKVNRSFEIL